MPYHLEHVRNGFYVVTTATGKRHSNAPLPYSHAVAQMRAMYWAMHNEPRRKLEGGKGGGGGCIIA